MSTIRNTPCGQIQGTTCQWQGVTAYKGIRYATAGRWEYPVQVTHWDSIYDATKYGNCSYQPRAFYNEENVPEKAFYYNEFRRGEAYTYSEDCLFLNIWTPENADEASKLPVLVYIHGGGYTGGCGHEKHFDGPIWPTKGVIGVTINYRLGPMGFVCLPELAAEAGHTGNYGLYDQMAALKWVQDNISAFGGDPTKVTIMGQSAGAMSVQQLCLSPLTDGLFSKAVMSSGGGVHKMMSAAPAENHYDFWKMIMEDCGCRTLDEFRAIPVDSLFTSWQKIKKTDRKYSMAAAPCLDGAFITNSGVDAVASGKQKSIPYLIGSTSQDIMPPIIHKMAKNWCATQVTQNRPESFCWFFDRKLPGDKNGAWHSSDLWYWFGTLANGWRPFTDKDHALSEQMTDYLTNFVKTGNPNHSGASANSSGSQAKKSLPEWKPVTAEQKKVLRMGEGNTRMGNASLLKLTYTMFTNKAVGE